jgi:hypothetical protein
MIHNLRRCNKSEWAAPPGSVITQKDKPLAFYSRKLTDSQTRYTVTELELLATRKHFMSTSVFFSDI